jgi:hypothetical protein
MIARLGRALYSLGCVFAVIAVGFALVAHYDMTAVQIFLGIAVLCWICGRGARYILSNE